MPVSALDAALTAFEDLPVVQAVTELDVTTGTPVTDGEARSSRATTTATRSGSSGRTPRACSRSRCGASPTAAAGAATPAHRSSSTTCCRPSRPTTAIVDDELPARQRTANVFAEDVPLDDATSDVRWSQLPLNVIDDATAFQLRWAPDNLTAYVTVDDATVQATDAIEIAYAGQTVTFGRDGSGDVDGVVTERDGGYEAVVKLPLATPVAEGGTLPFDLRVTDGAEHGRVEHPGRDGHAHAHRAALVRRGGCRGDGARDRRRGGRLLGRRHHRPDRQADQRHRRRDRGGPHPLEGQHAVRARGGHRPRRGRLGLRPVDPGLGRDLRGPGQLQERLLPVRRHPDPDQRDQRGVVRHGRRGVPAEPAGQRHARSPTPGTSSRRRSACSRTAAPAASRAWTSR